MRFRIASERSSVWNGKTAGSSCVFIATQDSPILAALASVTVDKADILLQAEAEAVIKYLRLQQTLCFTLHKLLLLSLTTYLTSAMCTCT